MTVEWWAFLNDDEFWEWLRVLLAALLGALVGGLFTIRAQAVQAKIDREAQEQREIAADKRESARITAESRERLRAESMREVRELVVTFTSVHRDVQPFADSGATTKNPDADPVRRAWESRIWPSERSLEVDVVSLLIWDAQTRGYMRRIVRALDYAPKFARGGSPESTGHELAFVAGQLTSVAIEILGSYMRDESPSSEFEVMLNAIELHQTLTAAH